MNSLFDFLRMMPNNVALRRNAQVQLQAINSRQGSPSFNNKVISTMARHEQRWQQLLVTRAGQHLQEGQQSIDLPEQNSHQHLQQLENYVEQRRPMKDHVTQPLVGNDNLGYADTTPHHSCNRQNSIHDRNTHLFSSQSQSSSSSRGPYMELLSCPFEEDTILQNFLGEASQQQEDSMVTAPSPTMHIFYSNTSNLMVDQAISESLGNSSYYDHSSAMNHQQLLFPAHQQMTTQSHHQGSQSPMEIQHDNYLDENLLFSMSSKSNHQHNSFIQHTDTSPCSLAPVMAHETKSTSISINNVSNNNSPMVTEDSEQEQSPDSSPNMNETENLPSDTDDEESGDYYERNSGAAPRFYCSRCPAAGQKGYRRLRELLSRHIRPFHYDVRFRCNTCGRKYTRSDSLTLHKNRKQH